MTPAVLDAFFDELQTKVAVSAATTLALLQRRAQQGVRVLPQAMEAAQHAAAAGASSTPAMARRAALHARDSVVASRELAQRIAPAAQNRQRILSGYEAASRGDKGVYTKRMMSKRYDYGATRDVSSGVGMAGDKALSYTSKHVRTVAPHSPGILDRPHQLKLPEGYEAAMAPPPVPAKMPPPGDATGVHTPSGKRRIAANTPVGDATQAGTPRSLSRALG